MAWGAGLSPRRPGVQGCPHKGIGTARLAGGGFDPTGGWEQLPAPNTRTSGAQWGAVHWVLTTLRLYHCIV